MTGPNIAHLKAGNLNGDSLADLVAVTSDGARSLVSHGDGTFSVQLAIPLFAVGTGKQAALADFNRDGKTDLAIIGRSEPGTQGWLNMSLGRGDGSFQQTAFYSGIKDIYSSVAAGDLDGDGLADVAVSRFTSSSGVDVFLSRGDGSFTRLPSLTSNQTGLSIADLDGDGDGEIVGTGAGRLQVQAHSSGTAFTSLPLQASCSEFNLLGDFNGDGRIDLVMTQRGSAAFLGLGDATFDIPRVDVGSLPYWVDAGDFNEDGKVDLVAGVAGIDDHISVLIGRGGTSFDLPVNYPSGNEPNRVAVGDFDRDGHQDIAATSLFDSVMAYFGVGDGTFSPGLSFPTGSAPFGLVSADLNHDGRSDLVVVNMGSNDVSVLLGRSDRSFEPQVRYPVGTAPKHAAAGDLDGDGDLDLVITNSEGTLSLLVGAGDGTFTAMAPIPAGALPQGVALADLDNDGDLDIVVGNRGPSEGEIAVHFGLGNGTFEPRAVIGPANLPNWVVAADFNRDGWIDIAASNQGNFAQYLSVQLNGGAAGFLPAQRFALCYDPFGMVVADFDRDGYPDIASATFSGVATLINQSSDAADTDGDGVPNGLDNCPGVRNASQSDFDNDFEGDVCDLNDGLILMMMPDPLNAAWQPEFGFDSFNLYRGDLAALRQSGVYTQDPGTVSLAMRACGLTDTTFLDGPPPGPGEGLFYLVAGVHNGVEGSLGKNSAGGERPNDNPCP